MRRQSESSLLITRNDERRVAHLCANEYCREIVETRVEKHGNSQDVRDVAQMSTADPGALSVMERAQ
jgi:hypothetical protein